MSGIWRFVLFVYNLLLLFVAGITVAAALGRPEPLEYIDLALSSPQNRVIVGVVGVVILATAIFVMFSSLKTEPKSKSIIIKSTLSGQVSITVAAVKIIIMKAVKQVEGIKEIKPVVSSGENGIMVYLHMMINPDYSVPEMSQKLQDIVKEYLENVGGLQVSEIRVLVDDFGPVSKSSGS